MAVAWTGLTNLVTVAPFHFAFVITGWLMLGRWDSLESYDQFTRDLTASLAEDATWYESLWVYTVNLFDQVRAALVPRLPAVGDHRRYRELQVDTEADLRLYRAASSERGAGGRSCRRPGGRRVTRH